MKKLLITALMILLLPLGVMAQDEDDNSVWGFNFNVELVYSMLEIHFDPMKAGFNNDLWFGLSVERPIKGPIAPKLIALLTVDSQMDSEDVGVKTSLQLAFIRIKTGIGNIYPLAAGVGYDIIEGEAFGLLGINAQLFGAGEEE